MSHRIPAALCLLALLLISAQVQPVASGDDASEGRRALVEALSGGDGEPVERVASALFTHGADALDAAVELLAGPSRALARAGREGASEIGDEVPELGFEQRLLLLRAIARHDDRAVRAEVRERLQRNPTPSERVALIQILRYAGNAADLPLLMRAAQQPADEAPSITLLNELQSAVRGIVERESPPVALLTRVTLAARPALQERVIAGTAPLRPLVRVRYLTDLLGYRRGLDESVLRALGGPAQAFGLPLAPGRLDVVRRYLHDDSIELAILAAHCSGGLHDFDAAPTLVDLLEAPDETLRRAAHAALKDMSGIALPAEPRRWRRWLERESEWVEETLARGFAPATDGPRNRAARLVNEVGLHRFRRHELAELLGRTLAGPHPRVAVLACAALRQLESLAALPALVDALRRPDASVAEAALVTLRALTKGDHETSYTAWRDAYAEEIDYLRDPNAW